MRNIIIILTLLILTGCATQTLEELYLSQATCEATDVTEDAVTGESCESIAMRIENRERRLDEITNGDICPQGYIEYEDRYGIACVDRRRAMDALNRNRRY